MSRSGNLAEWQRQQALAVAKAKYHGKVTEERARAAARNAHITRHHRRACPPRWDVGNDIQAGAGG